MLERIPTPSSQALSVGMAFHITRNHHLPDGFYRLCYVDQVYGMALLKRLPVRAVDAATGPKSTRERHLRKIELETLSEMLVKKSALLISDIGVDQRLTTEMDLGKRQREIYKDRLPLLKAMTSPEFFPTLIGDNFTHGIKVLGETFQVSQIQVKRLFYRLLESGLDIHSAAITSHKRCGKRSNKVYEKKQGRPRKHVKNGRAPEWAGINTREEHIRDIDIFIGTKHLATKSRAQNFKAFKAQFAVKKHQIRHDGRVDREMSPDDQFISIDQFGYHLKKRIALLRGHLCKRRNSDLDTVLRKRVLGTARNGIPYPSHTLIIDSTVADVWLVSAWDRTRLIGRPVIYIVIDAFSSAVLGMHVSLHNPSAPEAKIALFRAFTDKTEFLKNHGLDAYSDFFPKSPTPWELVFDRAELLSKEGKEIGESLQISMGVPPAYFPEWKAIVERHFGVLNKTSIHWLPGSTLGRPKERGERDVRLDAVLTMHEFTQIILRGVAMWNLRGSPLALLRPDQAIDTESIAPVDIFEWGLKNLHGTPRYIDTEAAAAALLPSETYSIGDRGITTPTLQWVGEWMQEARLIDKGLLDRPAKLFRSPDDPTIAFVHLQTERALRRARLSSRYFVEADFTCYDLDDMSAWMRDTKSIHKSKTEGAQTTSDWASMEILEQAKKDTAAAHNKQPQSKASRRRGVSENRRAEVLAASVTEKCMELSNGKDSHQPVETSSSFHDPGFAAACDDWESM
jgi:putative transposase